MAHCQAQPAPLALHTARFEPHASHCSEAVATYCAAALQQAGLGTPQAPASGAGAGGQLALRLAPPSLHLRLSPRPLSLATTPGRAAATPPRNGSPCAATQLSPFQMACARLKSPLPSTRLSWEALTAPVSPAKGPAGSLVHVDAASLGGPTWGQPPAPPAAAGAKRALDVLAPFDDASAASLAEQAIQQEARRVRRRLMPGLRVDVPATAASTEATALSFAAVDVDAQGGGAAAPTVLWPGSLPAAGAPDMAAEEAGALAALLGVRQGRATWPAHGSGLAVQAADSAPPSPASPSESVASSGQGGSDPEPEILSKPSVNQPVADELHAAAAAAAASILAEAPSLQQPAQVSAHSDQQQQQQQPTHALQAAAGASGGARHVAAPGGQGLLADQLWEVPMPQGSGARTPLDMLAEMHRSTRQLARGDSQAAASLACYSALGSAVSRSQSTAPTGASDSDFSYSTGGGASAEAAQPVAAVAATRAHTQRNNRSHLQPSRHRGSIDPAMVAVGSAEAAASREHNERLECAQRRVQALVALGEQQMGELTKAEAEGRELHSRLVWLQLMHRNQLLRNQRLACQVQDLRAACFQASAEAAGPPREAFAGQADPLQQAPQAHTPGPQAPDPRMDLAAWPPAGLGGLATGIARPVQAEGQQAAPGAPPSSGVTCAWPAAMLPALGALGGAPLALPALWPGSGSATLANQYQLPGSRPNGTDALGGGGSEQVTGVQAGCMPAATGTDIGLPLQGSLRNRSNDSVRCAFKWPPRTW